MKILKYALVGVVALQAVGCAMVAEKTNTLNEDDVRRLSARSIGYEPDSVKVLSRSTEGTNTYVTVQTKDGKQYSCTINGGNYLSGFMVNPPQCLKK